MLNRNFIWTFCFLPFLNSNSFASDAPALSSGTLRLETVLSAADDSNPDIRAARAAMEMAQSRVRGSAAWPDPMVTLSKEKWPTGERMNHVKAEQEIPFPGKLSQEADMKRHEAHIAAANYRAKVLSVLADVRAGYYRIYRSEQLAAKLQQEVDLTKAILRLAEKRYSSPGSAAPASPSAGGMGGPVMAVNAPANRSGGMGTDLFSLQAETGQMENMLLEQKQERTLMQIEINKLLNRPPMSALGPTEAPVLKDIPFPLDELLRRARENDPMYMSAMNEQEHSKAMLARARLGFAPDFGVMYDRSSMKGGMTGYEAGVSFSVPLWFTRPLSELKEAKAHRRESDAMAEETINDIERMVSVEFTETNTNLLMARNLETAVIPFAESAFTLARRRYESGGGDLGQVLQAARTLIAAQKDYYDRLAWYGEHWGHLEQWVGIKLDGPGASQGTSGGNEHRHTGEKP